MNTQPNKDRLSDLDRRSFLKGSSLSTLMLMMGGVPLHAQETAKPDEQPKKPVGPPVKGALIGCGPWGRDQVLNTLARLPNAPVVAICDTYEPFLRRAKEAAPQAELFTDYRKVLERKDVQAVLVTTPSHQHREIVEAAFKAGKHVYCEAPLAHTVEDARAIAKAAKTAAPKQYFQAGLQMRSDPQRHFLLPFIRSGAIGKWVMARAQWHKKESWRRTSPNADRLKEINWRLQQSTSPGLIGELGIHQLDVIGWFQNSRPLSVTGFGGIMNWDDGRDVPDTVQAVIEYKGGMRFVYDATLANSFDSDYEVVFGTDAAIMLRQNKAWMFKEVDSPLLGWEVYAQKETFFKETGIALVADATKLSAVATKAVEEVPFTNTPLSSALEALIANVGIIASAVDANKELFGEDESGLPETLAKAMKNALPAAGYQEAYDSTVVALKANEAVVKGQKVTFQKEWFELS